MCIKWLSRLIVNKIHRCVEKNANRKVKNAQTLKKKRQKNGEFSMEREKKFTKNRFDNQRSYKKV